MTLKVTDILSSYFKLRNYGRIDAILQLLINCTFAADGQSVLIRISGLLNFLFDLLSCKNASVRLSSIYLLRNLALLKENKAHFLVDGIASVF